MKKDLQSQFSTRQYMIEDDFELYFYNDASLERVKPHAHDFYEFYFFLSGSAQFTIGNITNTVKKGNMAIVPPSLAHHVEIIDDKEPYKRFIFWVSKSYVDKLVASSPAYGLVFETAEKHQQYLYYFDLFEFNLLQNRILEIIEEKFQDRFGKQEKIYNSLNNLLMDINRKVYSMDTKVKEPPKSLFINVLGYIDRHLEDDLSLDSIASHFYVSKYHLSHIFKDNLGISLHQYILKKRLKVASAAIIASQDISSIYSQFGFRDYSSFYRAFRNEYGMSPKQYRQNYQNNTEMAPANLTVL